MDFKPSAKEFDLVLESREVINIIRRLRMIHESGDGEKLAVRASNTSFENGSTKTQLLCYS